jgi:toxin YhaV
VGAARDPVPPPVRNGWSLYQWTEFGRVFSELVAEVEELERNDPRGYRSHPTTKRLAAIYRLATDIFPRNPSASEFRQGNTLGKASRHWFSAGFYERYRLFFRFRSDQRIIVYVWVNDDSTLRARDSRTDAYEVFRRMLRTGRPPEDWNELLAQSEALRLRESP